MDRLRSPFATSNRGRRRDPPFCVHRARRRHALRVLRSDKAVHGNDHAYIRAPAAAAFLAPELAGKLAALEKKFDAQFKGVLDAIRELMRPMEKDRRPIGFGPQ